MKPEEAHLAAVDIDSGSRLRLGSDSVQWNEFRRRWIIIASRSLPAVRAAVALLGRHLKPWIAQIEAVPVDSL
jgi:hypothetical protein